MPGQGAQKCPRHGACSHPQDHVRGPCPPTVTSLWALGTPSFCLEDSSSSCRGPVSPSHRSHHLGWPLARELLTAPREGSYCPVCTHDSLTNRRDQGPGQRQGRGGTALEVWAQSSPHTPHRAGEMHIHEGQEAQVASYMASHPESPGKAAPRSSDSHLTLRKEASQAQSSFPYSH